MTSQELTARAIARAHAEHVYIRRTDRPGVYSTCSKSQPGQKYTLVSGDGIVACSCPGYAYRQSCKHVEALRNRLAREAARPVAAPVAAAPAPVVVPVSAPVERISRPVSATRPVRMNDLYPD